MAYLAFRKQRPAHPTLKPLVHTWDYARGITQTSSVFPGKKTPGDVLFFVGLFGGCNGELLRFILGLLGGGCEGPTTLGLRRRALGPPESRIHSLQAACLRRFTVRISGFSVSNGVTLIAKWHPHELAEGGNRQNTKERLLLGLCEHPSAASQPALRPVVSDDCLTALKCLGRNKLERTSSPASVAGR